jgi:hypothetical protein
LFKPSFNIMADAIIIIFGRQESRLGNTMRRKGTLQDFPDDRLLAFIVFVHGVTCLPSR